MSGFQGFNNAHEGPQPFQFPPAMGDFTFMNTLQDGGMLGAGSQGLMWGGSEYASFDPLSQSFSGGGQTSLVQELNDLTLQVGSDPLGGVLLGQVSDRRSAPYAVTEGQLLPTNNGFQVNPALPGQEDSIARGAGDGSAPGNPQPGQPGPIFDQADILARLVAAEAKVSVHLEPSIRDELHKTCTDLIGCFEKVRLTDDPDEPPYYDLPQPLPAGTPDRIGPDGVSTLFNPRWDDKVTSSYNNRYIEAVIDVMTTTKQHLLDPVKHTRGVLKAAAREYLRSLKRARGFRLDVAGRARLERQRQIARRWNRRRAKVYELRKATIVLRKIVGHAQSVGLDNLVDTDWVSSEHSDATGSLEIRPVEWHSQKLRDLYASLQTIRAALPKGKTLAGASDVANPQDDGQDFTDEQRIEFLRITKVNIELRKLRAASQHKRFVGTSDERMRTKVVTKRFIHRDCVSEEWAATYLPADAAMSVQTPCPTHVTIWGATLPKELVDAKVRE
ncbi:hypothetical protein LXA43DRAFT_1104217 [Ganoderma leucocontextum]|nr:hypothetical protein LXA43DRAFT_1104217 [Ganoderma leucocontextum]